MIHIGDIASVERKFTKSDLKTYVRMGGALTANTIIPEPLIGGLFSYLLGVKVPGSGTMYLKQNSDFIQQATINDLLIASVEISGIRPEKKLIDLKTLCKSSDGKKFCKGHALVYFDHAEWPGNA